MPRTRSIAATAVALLFCIAAVLFVWSVLSLPVWTLLVGGFIAAASFAIGRLTA